VPIVGALRLDLPALGEQDRGLLLEALGGFVLTDEGDATRRAVDPAGGNVPGGAQARSRGRA
jgi:hypothetical protein